jgi:hypothetical protein
LIAAELAIRFSFIYEDPVAGLSRWPERRRELSTPYGTAVGLWNRWSLVLEDNYQAEYRRQGDEHGGGLVPGFHFVRNVQMCAPYRDEAPVWAHAIEDNVT